VAFIKLNVQYINLHTIRQYMCGGCEENHTGGMKEWKRGDVKNRRTNRRNCGREHDR